MFNIFAVRVNELFITNVFLKKTRQTTVGGILLDLCSSVAMNIFYSTLLLDYY